MDYKNDKTLELIPNIILYFNIGSHNLENAKNLFFLPNYVTRRIRKNANVQHSEKSVYLKKANEVYQIKINKKLFRGND